MAARSGRNPPGVNRVQRKLASGEVRVHYYHRATGIKLEGAPNTPKFYASYAAAESFAPNKDGGTLAGLFRGFEKTAKWRKLRDSTKVEYRRVFKFWERSVGEMTLRAVAHKTFRKRVLEWHDEFSAEKPREADNRVTILARVLSWAAADGDLAENVLEHFDRAYDADRSDMIWLPEHVNAFMAAADSEMQLAMVLALNTGQRQADIRKLAWSQYDGKFITLTQGKTGARVSVACTAGLKATLDAAPRRGTLILLTKTDKAFQKRYFAERWDEVYTKAKLPGAATETMPADPAKRLHFHDIRGTTVTLLFEAGCTVAEVASITGHSLRRAQEILDRYLSRTKVLAESAIAKFEVGLAKGATE